nr:hypothetical protein [Rugosimonospora africana]
MTRWLPAADTIAGWGHGSADGHREDGSGPVEVDRPEQHGGHQRLPEPGLVRDPERAGAERPAGHEDHLTQRDQQELLEPLGEVLTGDLPAGPASEAGREPDVVDGQRKTPQSTAYAQVVGHSVDDPRDTGRDDRVQQRYGEWTIVGARDASVNERAMWRKYTS